MSSKKCAQIGVCVFSIKACKGAAVAPDSKLILPQKNDKGVFMAENGHCPFR